MMIWISNRLYLICYWLTWEEFIENIVSSSIKCETEHIMTDVKQNISWQMWNRTYHDRCHCIPLLYCTVGNGSYGLGLILSHGYLLAHGGELWMTSEGEGKGSIELHSIVILLYIYRYTCQIFHLLISWDRFWSSWISHFLKLQNWRWSFCSISFNHSFIILVLSFLFTHLSVCKWHLQFIESQNISLRVFPSFFLKCIFISQSSSLLLCSNLISLLFSLYFIIGHKQKIAF